MDKINLEEWLAEENKKFFEWAKNLKPGDVFGACTAFNHYVAEISIRDAFDKDGSFLWTQVVVKDTAGKLHHRDFYKQGSNGCIERPYSLEEIKEYFVNFNIDDWEERNDRDGKTRKMIEDIKAGNYPYDDKGVLK